MKDFVKTMLAVICGYFVLRIIGFLFLLFFLVGSLAGSTPSLPKNGVLDLDMSTILFEEQSKDSSTPSMMSMNFDMTPVVGLHDAVEAIHFAASDPGVKYILLRADAAVIGMAGAEELRASLAAFRDSGKPVVAYVENPSNGSFFLSSVADKIYMGVHHGGNGQLIGLSAQLMFVKDILDKLGVHVQLIRHGKYKSAGEMYIRSSASPENREQTQEMVNSAWKVLGGTIAESRDLSEETFNALIDELALNLPEDYLRAGLVDELVDHETLLGKLCTLAQVEDSKKLGLIPFADYVSNHVTGLPGRSNVAVIYADGDIVDGKDYNNVAGDRFVQIIDQIRKDKSVKAVVLRVNSPGGSVAASEKIRAALDLLQKEKPLVASYGNYAASGGYWISNGCQKIYADATSITGSIGVFSMIPEFSEVTRKIGVGVETVGSNKHSDMFSLVRPFDKEEMQYMQASVEDIYERFVNLVASSRGMDPARVDEIGTLEDAITYAASLADFYSSDEYRVVGYPQPLTFIEEFMNSIGQGADEPSILSGTPFEAFGDAVSGLKAQTPGLVYARLPYALEIR